VKKVFSRKGAKVQRKTHRNAAALCIFARLREHLLHKATFVQKPHKPDTHNSLCVSADSLCVS
jgi:hypothetical protein